MTIQERELWLERVREAYREGFEDARKRVMDACRSEIETYTDKRDWEFSVSASYAKSGEADQQQREQQDHEQVSS